MTRTQTEVEQALQAAREQQTTYTRLARTTEDDAKRVDASARGMRTKIQRGSTPFGPSEQATAAKEQHAQQLWDLVAAYSAEAQSWAIDVKTLENDLAAFRTEYVQRWVDGIRTAYPQYDVRGSYGGLDIRQGDMTVRISFASRGYFKHGQDIGWSGWTSTPEQARAYGRMLIDAADIAAQAESDGIEVAY